MTRNTFVHNITLQERVLDVIVTRNLRGIEDCSSLHCWPYSTVQAPQTFSSCYGAKCFKWPTVMPMRCCSFKCSSKKLAKCEVSNHMPCSKMPLIIFSGVNEGHKINSEHVPGTLVPATGACMRIMTTSVGLAIALPMVPANEPAATLIHSGLCAESCPAIVCTRINNETVLEDEEEKPSYLCSSRLKQ